MLGTPTKILWLIACLVLAALPVTGVWMWWKRRPVGKTGFPRRPDTPVPWWLIGVIVLLGILLPVVGRKHVGDSTWRAGRAIDPSVHEPKVASRLSMVRHPRSST